jgi:hypothetical protein
MVTQPVLDFVRRWRSWIALAAVGLLVAGVLATQAFRPALAEDGLIVKAYSCPDGQAAVIADQLREKWGMVDGVRVAADARSSQVVVQAPREVQVWVGQQLAANARAKAAAAEASSPTGTPAQTRTVALRRSSSREIETALGDLMPDRLTTLSLPRDAVRAYRLAADNGSLDLSIDPNTSQVKLSGPASLVESTARVVQVLDGPTEGGRSVRLMALHTAHLDDVQRATAAIQTVSSSAPPSNSTLAFYQHLLSIKPSKRTAQRPRRRRPPGRQRLPLPCLLQAARPVSRRRPGKAVRRVD